MVKVTTGFSMSLDGFVAGPNDGPENSLGDGGDRLFKWYFSGDAAHEVPSGNRLFRCRKMAPTWFKKPANRLGYW